MNIAVISDLHDNLANWDLLLKRFSQLGITTLINCGDTCAPAMLRTMSETFPGQIYTVFGNVADKELETEKVKDWTNVHHYGEAGEFELAGKKFFINHYPKVARQKAATAEYDVVCYGHDHIKHAELVGQTLLLNPGTAAGMFQYPSFATINLSTLAHEFHELTV